MCHKKVEMWRKLETFFTTDSLAVVAQCLASWFSCQENSWIFEISGKDLGNYSWKGSQDFARSWKAIHENFWTSWQQNQEYPRSWQET